MTHPQNAPPEGFDTEGAMQFVACRARSTFYKLQARGLLPKPIKLGRKSVYLRVELQDALERAKHRRDGGLE